jgi:hypothetical protein
MRIARWHQTKSTSIHEPARGRTGFLGGPSFSSDLPSGALHGFQPLRYRTSGFFLTLTKRQLLAGLEFAVIATKHAAEYLSNRDIWPGSANSYALKGAPAEAGPSPQSISMRSCS